MSDAPIDIGPVDLVEEPDPEPPRSPSRVRRILLAGLLVAAVGGLGTLGWTAWQITSQKDAKLAAPASVGSLRLDNGEDAKSTADYLQTALAAKVDLDETMAGVYKDSTDASKDVLLFGGTALIWTPENDLDAAFDLISDNSGSVNGLHEVDAGSLGGTMKCGTTKTDDGDLAVCGWADHGSLALGMFTNRTPAGSAALFRQLRDASESR